GDRKRRRSVAAAMIFPVAILEFHFLIVTASASILLAREALVPFAVAAPAVVPIAVLPPIVPFDARRPRPAPFVAPPRTVIPEQPNAARPAIIDRTAVPGAVDEDGLGIHRIAARWFAVTGAADHRSDLA